MLRKGISATINDSSPFYLPETIIEEIIYEVRAALGVGPEVLTAPIKPPH
jgi:hypothetical protein